MTVRYNALLSRPLLPVLILMCTSLPTPVRAQVDSTLHLGPPFVADTRIRVTSPTIIPRRQILRFQAISNDMLFVTGTNDQPLKIERAQIHKIEYVAGKSRQWKGGIKWGAITGFTAGAIYGGATGGVMNGFFGTKRKDDFPSRARVAVEYGLSAMVAGAIYGVAIGALIKRDRWVSVPLKATTSP